MTDVSFVITAPSGQAPVISFENRVRQTHGVLIDIIVSAKKYIVYSSPYLRDLSQANNNINNALISALKRGVQLSILSTSDALKNINLDQYKGYNIHIYTPFDFKKKTDVFSHAKFCLSDGIQVYLGSANFTFAGLNNNLEMGVFSKGTLAKQVESFWAYMMNNDYLACKTFV